MLQIMTRSLNSDGQQFFQQSGQSPLTSNHSIQKDQHLSMEI